MNAFIISLHKPIDKINYLQLFDVQGILFEGVDGKKVTHKEVREYVGDMYSIFGPKSAIGCAMSHMKLWERVAQGDNPFQIIFEDDIILQADFKQYLENALTHVPNDFDLLYLGNFGSEHTPNFFTSVMSALGMSQKEQKINEYIKKPAVCLGLHAYIVSKQGAEKLLSMVKGKLNHHLDYMIQYLHSNDKINVYTVSPRIAFQTSTDHTIQSSSENVQSRHPQLINDNLSNVFLDTMVSASYINCLSLVKLGNVHLNIMSILFIVAGILLAWLRYDTLILLFIFLSMKDLIENSFSHQMLFNYMLFTTPSLIF